MRITLKGHEFCLANRLMTLGSFVSDLDCHSMTTDAGRSLSGSLSAIFDAL